MDVAEMRRLYVDEELTTYEIANLAGTSSGTVWKRLVDAGVQMRPRGVKPRLSDDELRHLYVDQRLSTVQIAERTGMSTSGVTAALQRAGIPRRGAGVLMVDDETLRRLYVHERLDAELLAASFDVPTWTVRRRLSAAGIQRPAAPPAGFVPAETELHRRYVDGQASLAELAAHYRVPATTVRRWLELLGIALRDVPASQGGRAGDPVRLSRDELWELYVEQGLTATQIGDHVGVTKNVITAALHTQRIPMRPPGPSRTPPVVLLDALYADGAVTAVLARHGIPRRPQAGWLRQRWPDPVEPSAAALKELYIDVGLSAAHISLLTGLQVAGVRARLQRAGLRARSSSRSPWKPAT
jgi:hypothetical protein